MTVAFRDLPEPSWRSSRKGPTLAALLHGGAALALALSGAATPPAVPPVSTVAVELVAMAAPIPAPAPAPTPAPPPLAAAPAAPAAPAPPSPRPPTKTKAPVPVPAPVHAAAPAAADQSTMAGEQGGDGARVSPLPVAAPMAAAADGSADTVVPPRSDVAGLNNPKPPYPPLARRRGLEGLVVLAVWVDDVGAAQSVSVHQSSGHGILDQAAVDTVRNWRFIPARRGGHTVAAAVQVPIRFALGAAG